MTHLNLIIVYEVGGFHWVSLKPLELRRLGIDSLRLHNEVLLTKKFLEGD